MKVVEATAKTVEEATQKALAEIALPTERVKVEVVTEPSAGFLGLIGSKQARVRVTETISPAQYMYDFLEQIIGKIGLTSTIEVTETAQVLKLSVNGSKMGILIGKRGQTLNALQYLLSVVYHKKFPGQDGRLLLDVEDYREKREETLRTLAQNLAKKALRSQREVVLEPMSPQERRIIHTELQEHAAVSTYSEGDEPYRKVIIAPK
ncbi:MAG TPA: RNA-binding cell elongation regulator Jag/EloR [Oscillospiraceae bacterium]|nr:RNA-binding cell elongation regulator Jag/EloR [Oscillospiraceae bacterium]